MDFLYNGEANVAQDDLNKFLEISQDLKIKGLDLGQNKYFEEHSTMDVEQKFINTPAAPIRQNILGQNKYFEEQSKIEEEQNFTNTKTPPIHQNILVQEEIIIDDFICDYNNISGALDKD